MRVLVILLFSVVLSFVEMSDKQQHSLQNVILQEQLAGVSFQALDPKPIANIDYMFSGYNLFEGNPITWSQSCDPGFTGRNIFNPNYSHKTITSDGRYKVPNALNVITKKGCKFNFQSRVMKSGENIQNYMSTLVGINLVSNFEYTPWAFTASAEYNHMQTQIEQKSVVFVASSTTCQVIQATMNHELPELSDSFIAALKQLPKDYVAAKYIEFIKSFGTHYPVELSLGSRSGYVFTMPKATMAKPGVEDKDKFKESDLEQAASITSSVLKGAIALQILPTEQSSKAFTDISKVSANSFIIEVGAQSKEGDTKEWLKETEKEPIPIQYKLKSIADLVSDARWPINEIPNNGAIAKNIRKAYIDYCKLLSLENKRNGSCEANKREIGQWIENRVVCLNLFEQCDFSGENVSLCGNKNPIQEIGADLPVAKANSVRFHSSRAVLLGSVKYKRDKDQKVVMKSFNEDYLIIDKMEICLLNQGMPPNAEYPVYITDSLKCVVVLIWNVCGAETFYFTSVICNGFNLEKELKDILNVADKCEIALLDIKYINTVKLRICLFKELALGGAKVCFSNDQKPQYMGQTFKSMIIEQHEVMVHRQMPGSVAVVFG